MELITVKAHSFIAQLGADPTGVPWVDHIINKSKTWEGRLNKGKWQAADVGDYVSFTDATGRAKMSKLVMKIIAKREFGGFDEAWLSCPGLLPTPADGQLWTPPHVQEYYLTLPGYQEAWDAMPVSDHRVVVFELSLFP